MTVRVSVDWKCMNCGVELDDNIIFCDDDCEDRFMKMDDDDLEEETDAE